MKKAKMSPDLLSNLPLEIIHDILSLIPIKEAIRTSLLSTQWRYTWTSLPNIIFDCKCVCQLIENKSDVNRLFDFISQTLLHHDGPIHKFKLWLPRTGVSKVGVSKAQFQRFDQKLLFSFSNDIRSLVFQFNTYKSWTKVSSSLYSCQNLNHLDLTVRTIPPPPPSFKGFLFLRSLMIEAPKVDSSTVESIVALSPLLEELKLCGTQHSEMTIRAPNLKFFQFYSFSDHLSLCTPLLEELTLQNAEDVKYSSFHGSCVFNHLRIIKLTNVAMAVNYLIKCSPNLQKLEIRSFPHDAPELVWDTESAPDFTYDSLKEITISILSSGGIYEMELARFLLARSPALERMIYRRWSYSAEQVKDELLSCPRASANAEVVIEERN